MATTLKSDLGNLLLAGSRERFNAAVKKPREMYWKQCVRIVQEDGEIGNYDTVGNLTAATVHNENSPVVFDKIEYNNRTSITNIVYEKGVKASLEAQRFDRYKVVVKQFGEPLVQKLNLKKERIVADAYNHAFTDTGADGVAIISDSHPLKNNALLYNDNLITGELGVDSIKAGKMRFNHIYDQAGEFYGSRPTHLLIHPDKAFIAYELLNSALMAYSLNQTKNVLQDISPMKILENPYLDYNVSTNVSPWFMLDKGIDEAGCVMQTNMGLTLHTWFENSDLTFKGIAYEIYGVGMTAPGYGLVGAVG